MKPSVSMVKWWKHSPHEVRRGRCLMDKAPHRLMECHWLTLIRWPVLRWLNLPQNVLWWNVELALTVLLLLSWKMQEWHHLTDYLGNMNRGDKNWGELIMHWVAVLCAATQDTGKCQVPREDRSHRHLVVGWDLKLLCSFEPFICWLV